MNTTATALPRPFAWLNLTQFFGALNDNLLKLLIIFFLIGLQGPEQAAAIAAKAGAVFVIPFLLFAPLAGILADRLSKSRIILAMKGAELLIALGAVAAFALASPAGLYGTLFLMAVQSALFGPAKYGVVPELVERRQLSRANSLLETLTYLAIILGCALAPLLVQATGSNYRLAAGACILVALAGLGAGRKIVQTPAAAAGVAAQAPLRQQLRETLSELRQDGYLMLAILGSAYFMFFGAFAQINLIPLGMQELGLTQEQSGYLFLVAALGIGAGSLLAGRLSGRNVEFGVVPIGAFGLAFSAGACYWLAGHLVPLLGAIFLLGLSAGLFLVPLHAFVQFRAPRERLGRILAAGSFLSWCGVLLASALAWLLSGPLGLSAVQALLALGLLTVGLSLVTLWILPDFLLRFIALVVIKLAYRIQVSGEQHVPTEGAALLVANHVTWIDALLLLATQQRRIRFIMHGDVFKVRLLQPLFRLMQVIPVYPRGSREERTQFLRSARQALDEGYLVCIFAEGMITRNGMLQPFKAGLEAIVKGSGHPIIPVYIGGAWGSLFSYVHGRLLTRLPASFPYPISVAFGAPMPATAQAAEVQQAVAELACDCFQRQLPRRTSLAAEFVRSARCNWRRRALADGSGRSLSFGQALSGALALAGQLRSRLDGQPKVGVLLPPSVGGALANLALSLLGRVPVNLNYTAAAPAVGSAIAQCDLSAVITSRAFLAKLAPLPLPAQVLCLEDLLPALGRGAKLWAWFKARLLPLALLLPGPRRQGGELATVIFSSGSTGEPKGVLLSQHNILSNLEAIRMVAATSPRDDVCSALPFFHALGFTATLWLPLVSGFSASYHVNPMDAAGIAALVRRQRSTLLLATPTFLATYMRRAEAQDFASLRLVVTGAEKLKSQLADAFAEKYGVRPLEGYGATELAPLITLNLPDVTRRSVHQRGQRSGSVGRAIPGVVLRVVDPDSLQPLPLGQQGLIQAKGPNLMLGYLNRPEQTAAAIVEGWYQTGDIGRIDREGFVFITDRLARFSKIGGEMVPHIRVEEAICQALGLYGSVLAVTALPDERKGEKLVVLYTEQAGEKGPLVQALKDAQLPNLWRPQAENFIKVDALPLLGSGKLDLGGLRKLAAAALG
ncbi:acyl-[ACP]--phospholipid O-acyltransferase [Geoalkalibacter sp.]|uniref:acyl-[ACP]--phospholipid O-acyltransferase n=1 Tax=Geoalkalibacter sp. TaxID=3041440 RepID=UPI00272E3F51|nr:acyl-[ACP]--phospholipid O-acyltransferase [Geoalkalibacter sp.]